MSIAIPIRHLFDGVSYPAARVVPDSRRELFNFDNPVWTPNAPSAVGVETSGKGRRWSATEPMAFWMTFCEININDDQVIVDWIARYGDPNSALKPGNRVHTAHWHTLRSMLRRLRHAWAIPTADAYYEIARIDPDRYAAGGEFVDHLDRKFQPSIEVDGTSGINFRYQSLGDYMLGSAIFMWRDRTLARRCVVCNHFFSIKRSTALVCSSTCHAKRYQQQKQKRDS